MDIYEGLYNYLQSLSGITGAVGDKIYPQQAPAGTAKPYVTVSITDGEQAQNLNAASALNQPMFEFKIFADSPDSRTVVAEAFRNNLHGRKNIAFPLSSGSIAVRSIRLEGTPTDDIEDPDEGSEQSAFVKYMDFRISFVETAPTLP